MTEQEKDMRKAICINPYDFGPRMIYQDWCEEQGLAERAEYIRNELKIHELKTNNPHQYMSMSSDPQPLIGPKGVEQWGDERFEKYQSESIDKIINRNAEIAYEAWTKEFMEMLGQYHEDCEVLTISNFRWVNINSGVQEEFERPLDRVNRFVLPDLRDLEFVTSDPIVSDYSYINKWIKIAVDGQLIGPGWIHSVMLELSDFHKPQYRVSFRLGSPAVYQQQFTTKWGLPYRLDLPLATFIKLLPNITWPITEVTFTDQVMDRYGEFEDRINTSNHPYSFNIRFTSVYGIPDWLMPVQGAAFFSGTFSDKAVKHLRETHNLPPLPKGK